MNKDVRADSLTNAATDGAVGIRLCACRARCMFERQPPAAPASALG